MSSSFLRDFYRRYYGETVSSLAERHTSVEVIGSSPILVLFYFFINQERGILRRWSEI